MADLATLQAQLVTAEAAYEKLLNGSSEEEVAHGDTRVKYSRSPAAMQQLGQRIIDLKAQIAAAGGSPAGLRRRAFVIDGPGHC